MKIIFQKFQSFKLLLYPLYIPTNAQPELHTHTTNRKHPVYDTQSAGPLLNVCVFACVRARALGWLAVHIAFGLAHTQPAKIHQVLSNPPDCPPSPLGCLHNHPRKQSAPVSLSHGTLSFINCIPPARSRQCILHRILSACGDCCWVSASLHTPSRRAPRYGRKRCFRRGSTAPFFRQINGCREKKINPFTGWHIYRLDPLAKELESFPSFAYVLRNRNKASVVQGAVTAIVIRKHWPSSPQVSQGCSSATMIHAPSRCLFWSE